MKVLVSGAGGFLGRHVVERLVNQGHKVRAIIRPASITPGWNGDVENYRADLRCPDTLSGAFEGIDAMIHLAAAPVGGEDLQFSSAAIGTENLLNAMANSSTRRLIHVSSLAVYDWSQAKVLMDEGTPLQKHMYDMGGYAIAKVWQERVVTKFADMNAWDLTILRPGFIWGSQHTEIAGMGRRLGRVYLIFGPFTRLPLSYVVNCADCIVATLENRNSIGQTFNVIDSDDVRIWRYAREHAVRTGQRAWFVPIPYFLGLATAHLAAFVSMALFGDRGKLPSLLTPRRYVSQFKPLRFSNRKVTGVLGWTPPLSFEECLRQAYQ